MLYICWCQNCSLSVGEREHIKHTWVQTLLFCEQKLYLLPFAGRPSSCAAQYNGVPGHRRPGIVLDCLGGWGLQPNSNTTVFMFVGYLIETVLTVSILQIYLSVSPLAFFRLAYRSIENFVSLGHVSFDLAQLLQEQFELSLVWTILIWLYFFLLLAQLTFPNAQFAVTNIISMFACFEFFE